MKKYTFKMLALATLTCVLVSCQKEGIESDTDISAAQSVADVESTFDDASDQALFCLAETQPSTSGCPTVTYAQPVGTYPNTVTLDYGTGCTAANGRVRSGQIVVQVTGSYTTPGMVRTITPVNFAVNDWTLEGTRTVTNLGNNESSQMQWSVEVENAKLTQPGGDFATWNALRTRTLIAGAETDGCEDDVYQITGGSSGVSFRGVAVTATIVTPITKATNCRWPQSGVREVQSENRNQPRRLDYGPGECDDQATLTLPNGQVRPITLRR
ncbi:MAG: hypothetical protein AAGN35_07930 [Bacteroidota bacterium]